MLVAALDANLDGNPFVPRLLRFGDRGRLRGSPHGGDVVLPMDIGHLLVQPDGRIVTATFDVGPWWIVNRLEPPWGAPPKTERGAHG